MLAAAGGHGDVIARGVLSVGHTVVGADTVEVIDLRFIAPVSGGEIHVQPLLLGGHAEVQQRLGDPKIDGRAVGVEVRLYVKGVDRGVDIAELLRRILIDGVIAVDQQELPAGNVHVGRLGQTERGRARGGRVGQVGGLRRLLNGGSGTLHGRAFFDGGGVYRHSGGGFRGRDDRRAGGLAFQQILIIPALRSGLGEGEKPVGKGGKQRQTEDHANDANENLHIHASLKRLFFL